MNDRERLTPPIPLFHVGDSVLIRNGGHAGAYGTITKIGLRNKGHYRRPVYYNAYLIDRGDGTVGWYRESGLESITINEEDVDHAQDNLQKILNELAG